MLSCFTPHRHWREFSLTLRCTVTDHGGGDCRLLSPCVHQQQAVSCSDLAKLEDNLIASFDSRYQTWIHQIKSFVPG